MKLTLQLPDKHLEKFTQSLFKENLELKQKIIELEEQVEHLENLLLNVSVVEVGHDKR
jgi:cell division septum initiation protein DivIVA